MQSNIKLATIQKTSIENINVDLKYLYNIDTRFSLSNEKQISDSSNVITEKNADIILEKKRYSFNFNIFSLDLTEIIKINKKTEKFEKFIEETENDDNNDNNENVRDTRDVREASKYQVELEIKHNKLSNEEILEKINNVLKLVLGLINS